MKRDLTKYARFRKPAAGWELAFKMLMSASCPYCGHPLINVTIANADGPPELSWVCIEGCNP